MKIPEPEQLPSGKWYIKVMVGGKRTGKTFDSKEDAIFWASGVKTKRLNAKKSPKAMTLGEAIDQYIESKDSVLSPSTIAGYRRIRENHFQELMSVRLDDLSQERLQRAVNAMARQKSPKTVSNAYGLVTAALGAYLPGTRFYITLPQKQRTDIVVPTEADIRAICKAVRGKSVELPTLLAMFMGLRMSEIRGLTWDCIKGNQMHIRQAMVDEGLKTTKTYNSNRVLTIPPYIVQLLEKLPHSNKDDFIFHDTRRAIHSRFEYWVGKSPDITQHYRFHDLRHVNASVMLALNIPDKYAMKRMGHATSNMLKTVYQHTMTEEEARVNAIVNDYFDRIMDNE